MSQLHSHLVRILLAVALGAVMLGCPSTPGVGDPCDPEQVPEAPGFDPSETYLETNSVQCRTRVCMVRNFDGIPQGDEDEIYCTCRCFAEDANTPTCGCPNGFTCEPILE